MMIHERTMRIVAAICLLGEVRGCECPRHTTDQNKPWEPGCVCALDSGYVWNDPSCDISAGECSAITYTESCQADHGSHSHSSGHSVHGSGVNIRCACDDGYDMPDGGVGNCKPTPTNQLAGAIQDAAPDQTCTIEIWYPDSLGEVIDTVIGSGGQTDCAGNPSAKGDCVETIQNLVGHGGELAELAANLISAMSGTNAVEICNEICVKGCFGVLGWAMWPASPCILDAAPIATFRIICLPPWGLVVIVAIFVVCKVCCSSDDDESSQPARQAPARSQPRSEPRRQPLSIPMETIPQPQPEPQPQTVGLRC